MRMLVSSVGVYGGLFAVDAVTGDVDRVFPSYAASGFCWRDGVWWVIDRCRLNLYSPDLWLRGEVNVGLRWPYADLHDVAARDEYVYGAVTGANAVEVWRVEDRPSAPDEPNRIRVSRVGAIFFDRVDGVDWRHVNSVCAAEDGLYVSMFALDPGFPPGTRWREVVNGGIVFVSWDNLNSGLVDDPIQWTPKPHMDPDPPTVKYDVMVSDVRHPHSLAIYDGHLYFCESLDQRLSYIPLNGGEKRVAVQIPNGYARGHLETEEYVAIGASSTEAHPHTLPDSDRKVGAIYLYHRESASWWEIEIPGAQEVYQISELRETQPQG